MLLPRLLELLGDAGVRRVVDQTPLVMVLLLLRLLMLLRRLMLLLLKRHLVHWLELNRLKIGRAPITDGGVTNLDDEVTMVIMKRQMVMIERHPALTILNA